MKKFLGFIVGVVLTAGFGYAANQLIDLNVSSNLSGITGGLIIAPASLLTSDTKINASRVTRSLGNSATIDFSSSTAAPALSSSITVTGARAGDPCHVGVPTAAAALQAEFGCFVDATDSVKVQFVPSNIVTGTATLNGGSPATITAAVPASSVCQCTIVGTTAAHAAAGCAVSVTSTTLTMTSANTLTNVVNYRCEAPVDPASGTFFVRVTSSQ